MNETFEIDNWREKYGGLINWELTKATVFMRDEYRCLLCKEPKGTKELRVHQVVPLSRGGSNELRNLITVCVNCHKFVHPNNGQIW